jgi:ATP-dependent Clp protease ATP-binding subunit ClpX
MRSLSLDEITEVMTKPRNALVKQYQAYFAMDDCKLEFTEDALRTIAEVVTERETGVRALRSLFEDLLLDLRYTLPTQQETNSYVITKEFVEERLDADPRQPGEAGEKRETA